MSLIDKYKILVADDNHINIKVAEFTLKPLASRIDFARNGKEAIDKIENFDYDVVFMDVKMPVMDGYEATLKIRENEKINAVLKPLKIIAITANNQAEEINYCKKIGMDDFLSKPFTTHDALAVLHAVFES